jgi:hypothetical protein
MEIMEIDNYIGVILLVGIISFAILHFFHWKIQEDIKDFKREMERDVHLMQHENHVENMALRVEIRDWNHNAERIVRDELKRQWDNGVKARRVP